MSHALKKLKGELFKEFVESNVLRARTQIICLTDEIDDRFGFGEDYEVSSSDLELFKSAIEKKRKVSDGILFLLDKMVWLSNSDIALALKEAYPGLSSEASQIIWGWDSFDEKNVVAYDERLWILIENAVSSTH